MSQKTFGPFFYQLCESRQVGRVDKGHSVSESRLAHIRFSTRGPSLSKCGMLALTNLDVSPKRPTYNMVGSTHCGIQICQDNIWKDKIAPLPYSGWRSWLSMEPPSSQDQLSKWVTCSVLLPGWNKNLSLVDVTLWQGCSSYLGNKCGPLGCRHSMW